MRGCKKVQKKCKKMQYLLHMSKKSSIFAPDLGIVPSITLKNVQSMKKVCIFRCQFNGNTYRVLMSEHPHFIGEHVYFAYKGRRKLDGLQWNSFAGAVGSILCEMEPDFTNNFRRVWL